MSEQSPLDLKSLRHFAALVEHQGFIRAGEAIGLSQPALSRSIQTLEHRLGCALIKRGGKGVELTPQGQLVLAHAKRLLAGSTALKNALRQFNDLEDGELLIGAGPFPAADLLPRVLGQFNQRYPGVRVRLEIQHWVALRRQLLAEELELFVADIRELEGDPLLQVEPLQQEPSLLFCRAGHPLIKQAKQLTPAQLAEYPLASFRLPGVIEQLLQDTFPRDTPLISLECDNLDVLKRLVMNCDALSFASHSTLAAELARGELVLLDWPKLMPGTSFGLVTRLQRPLSPAAIAFIAMLKAAAVSPAPVAH
ncbi:LysR family transcriptional regulator [Pseudomonas neustonica]|mgnify:FL=1|uniref:LysR family transcriptional regulator n=1 Tax=Pseudomonas neustonica TaxID=2487346 RepID=A0ABX9XHD1_9PSED|nr:MULTISPECIES: LysR family transcriptional regulator [Pseudomonas]MAB25434.1 LysR family transcriptional regulator [Pseudomonadales bacterium]ROZ82420.1 LysR family transcriptional regulator [Pseudomonas sp. SSM44]ROZ84332.1 LysR family transcriptional regulator [Pseudomonas neustonica]|tara:strand:- start:20455 stop:21381 length:927 start_codon:yes stop_codon:yes gene_type:complete